MTGTGVAAVLCVTFIWAVASAAEDRPLKPVVAAEQDLYEYKTANNGADPMWCHRNRNTAGLQAV